LLVFPQSVFCVVLSLSLSLSSVSRNKQTNKQTRTLPSLSLSLSLFSLSLSLRRERASALLDAKKKTPTEAFNRENYQARKKCLGFRKDLLNPKP